MPLRRVVLDTLKPHDPDILVLAKHLSALRGVSAVNVGLVGVDRNVETVKITIEGEDVPFGAVREVIHDLGGTVHSIDEVAAGTHIIGAPATGA